MTAAELLARFPDVYDKRPDGNLGKLMAIIADQLDKVQQTLAVMLAWRSIDAAEGTTLDRIGENVAQDRGVATDEIYRMLIKSKIARNMSTADINTMIRVIAIAVGAPYDQIAIRSKYEDPIDPEPAAIALIGLPLTYVNSIGISLAQFARIIQRTAAAGVRVESVELQGTFEFGDLPLSTSSTAGVGDVNDPSIGGELGAAFDPNDDQNLPI